MPSRPLPPPLPHHYQTSPHNLRVLILSLTICGSVLIVLFVIFILLYLFFSIINGSRTSPLDSSSPLKLQRFSYKDLKSATSSFRSSNELGKGGSSTVFRGVLREGLSVAVKKLDSCSLEAEREFQNELQVLGGLRSPYLVSLLGFCVEKKKRILVYEFMPNRSLQEALFADNNDGSSGKKLDWEKRFKIIIDIAEAIKFLHLECDPPVIHGDIKPSNVLLSSDLRAKIADFGLSRVKTEGDFGFELFSQDLGKSQELLWKSQDLGKNYNRSEAATPVELDGHQTEKTEVDFALALQASSSNSRVDWNSKTYNLNCLAGNEDECRENFKGKEVSTTDVGEDWSKFGPSDDELCSFEHSKELNVAVAATASPVDVAKAKQWGKDWWWRQDGSGELCSKDYVMEWIGSQICPSTNPDWDEKKGDENPNLDVVVANVKKSECGEPMQVGELSFQDPVKRSEKREGKNSSKKHRKIKEWWKEEYFAEMSKKGKCNKLKKLDKKWKTFKMAHCCKKVQFPVNLGLGRKFRSRTENQDKGNCKDGNENPDTSFRNGWRKKKNQSTGSELWSGDLFSRELSSTTSMRGTVCYVAPEYGGCGYLMEKADIYSFGVLILVIVSGRRPLHVLSSPMKLEKANLISWARHLAQAGNILDLVDSGLKGRFSKDQASLCINLALMCLQRMPEFRPDIGEIVKILKGEMELPTLPFEFSPSPPCKLSSKSRSRRKPAAEAE